MPLSVHRKRYLLAALLAVTATPALAQSPYSGTVFIGDSLTDAGYFRPLLPEAVRPITGQFTTNPSWVTTIGTPHHGTPLGDLISRPEGAPAVLVAYVIEQMSKINPEVNSVAMLQLLSNDYVEQFNSEVPSAGFGPAGSCTSGASEETVAGYSTQQAGTIGAHMYLTISYMWNNDRFPQLDLPPLKINWLQCIAIHESELVFLERHGPDLLEDLFEVQEVNTLDPNRQPAV